MPLPSSNKPAPSLDLPPPFHLVTPREAGDAFAHAQAVADDQGAGTLVFVGRVDLAEFAVVLEPEEPLRTARRALYAGMNALADALAVHAPPEKQIGFQWPDAVSVDGGIVGGARLAWPSGADEDAPPPWLVFGVMIRTVSLSDEPGLHPLSTALAEEGFTDFASGQLVESFARHLMVAIDAWHEHGFGVIARDYLARLSSDEGAKRAIDENGDLLVRHAADKSAKSRVERRPLLPALAAPSWLDPATGGPGG
jgi:biotin-(acetyl-CoA carboxylase) ligase